MHTAEILFRYLRDDVRIADAADAVEGLLVALERNGQLVPDTTRPDVEEPEGYRVVALIPEARSLSRSRYNDYVHQALVKVRECGLASPKVRVLGRTPATAPVCRCKPSASMILHTDFSTRELPLVCGGCGGRVPFSRFEPTSDWGTYEDITWWMHQYRAFDSIWIRSGAGERFAYRQISRHDSEVSKEGRELCRDIERGTRRPVYYYLMRHYGRSVAAERRRRCPACGGAWLLKERMLERYDFCCRRCRLVSNVACEVGDRVR